MLNISTIDYYLTAEHSDEQLWGSVKPLLFVRVVTDDGVEGWGEVFFRPEHKDHVLAYAEGLAQQALEKRTMSPQSFVADVARFSADDTDFHWRCVASGLEVALWDLWGKLLDQPVYQLLGVTSAPTIPLYANLWTHRELTIDELVDECLRLQGDGFNAFKVYPRRFADRGESVQVIAELRAALGAEAKLMLDLSVGDDLRDILKLGTGVVPYAPHWFEEPWSGDDPEVLAHIRSKTGLRIVTGEKHCGMQHFQRILDADAADVLNPDIVGCGGILETLSLAKLAENCSRTISPHCWNSMTVAFMSMLHVCAAVPSSEYAEYFPAHDQWSRTFSRIDASIDGGVATLGNMPGLGVWIDREKLCDFSTRIAIN
ncbi:MAG: mandelate racemase/muconate lactonizing enzyme family protein [Pseudomonadota bacterium]